MKLISQAVKWLNGRPCFADEALLPQGREGSIAYRILRAHHQRGASRGSGFHIRFDSLISHDITYVGIIQTARASGLTRFPLPYVMTNCHNSLCAVGGTINEDDHLFGLSAAKKYGGIFVPPNLAVIHQYAREMMSGCGRMILGSDSHTRYGALGTMGIGEGGPEIVKQLLENTYDIPEPPVVLVYVTGKPRHGVGPQDVALALCGAVYKNGFVKNKVLEFAGPGVAALPMDYRIGMDVMTTETACLSSIWQTDSRVQEYLTAHGREEAYRELTPAEGAVYDGMIELDLGEIQPMVALPFHPSEAFTLKELTLNAGDILRECEKRAEKQFGGRVRLRLTDKLTGGRLKVDQGIIAGCSGGMYDNIAQAEAILRGHDIGNGAFSLSVYPPSVPMSLRLMRSGVQQSLMESGVLFKSCFCGPCFGAGDVPANGSLSIRHTTRNFPSREGSRPGDGQLAGVLLMDARSIAATARNQGILTGADEIDYEEPSAAPYEFDKGVYEKRCWFGFGRPQPREELRFGPNITDWPEIPALPDNLLMELAAVIHDPVTTTDELIPSGETSSYRSNPLKLAGFALSRRVPEYVSRCGAIREKSADQRMKELKLTAEGSCGLGSVIYANCPGDGSAREQAASCQRVLGGCANIAHSYATKRYRSNCINWGLLPFTLEESLSFELEPGDCLFVPEVRKKLAAGETCFPVVYVRRDGSRGELPLKLENLSGEERRILLNGCLMNDYAAQKKE